MTFWFWSILAQGVACVTLATLAELPIYAARAIQADGIYGPLVVYYGSSLVAAFVAVGITGIPPPPINPSFVFFSFVCVVYMAREVFAFVLSVPIFPDPTTLEDILRLAILMILFIFIDVSYARLLVYVLDREHWGLYNYVHIFVCGIPVVVLFVLKGVMVPYNALVRWLEQVTGEGRDEEGGGNEGRVNESRGNEVGRNQESNQRVTLENEEIVGELPPPYFKSRNSDGLPLLPTARC